MRSVSSIPGMADDAVVTATRGVRLGRWSALVVIAAVLVCARFVSIGADTYWAVALGREIVQAGSIPDGIPFATASSAGWPNVPVLGELALAALAVVGPVGIVAAQLVLDFVALVLLAVGARRAGAGDGATAIALGPRRARRSAGARLGEDAALLARPLPARPAAASRRP